VGTIKKVKIQKGCLWLNGQLFKMGEVLEVDDKTADKLIKDGIVSCSVPSSNEVTKNLGVPQETKNNKGAENKEELTTLPPPNFTSGESK